MPSTANQDVAAIIEAAIAGVVARASASISKSIAEGVAAELRRTPTIRPVLRAARRAGSKASRSRPRVEVTKWVADRRARRVPNFVIEATGCKTKKAIVVKFGEDAVFKKGEPLPKTAKAA